MTAEEIIKLLELEPLPQEGGFFRRTYQCSSTHQNRAFSTAIYYLITPESFSALHRVKSDEIFHFYAGDPVEMLQITPAGEAKIYKIGTDLKENERPQLLVPRDVWQGLRLTSGSWALLGTTVSPGFEYEDFELADREKLIANQPQLKSLIEQFTRP